MTALFADTFYWIALTDVNDSSHHAALDLAFARDDALIDEVLVEFLTFFGARKPSSKIWAYE